jgi:hypothetical protein
MLTQSKIFTSLVAILMALNVTGCSGGGGGGDPGIPPGPTPGPSPIPTLDDHGDNVPSATVIYPGEEITTGFYNTPGDIDYFKIPVVEDQWYTVSGGAHKMTYYTDAFNLEGSSLYQILDPTGSTSMAHTGDWGWPGNATDLDYVIGSRFLWQAEYTGNYIYTRRSSLNNTIGSYAFKVASSQLAISQPLYQTSNFRSNIVLIDDSGEDPFEIYNGSASGSTSIASINLKAFGSNTVSITASTSTVTFKDNEGVPNDDPENNVWHIHQGTPSRLSGDNIDDAGQFGLFSDPNANGQDSDDPHPFIEELSVDTVYTGLELPLLHLLLETPWYVDAHITDNYDVYKVPIVSSLPMGGIKMFDSTHVLTGFDFPQNQASGSGRRIEIAYDDEYQIFYLPYGNRFDHTSLVGATVHVHAGGPTSSNNSPLINLGPVPAPEVRPEYEFGGSYIQHADDTDIATEFPGVETILYTLSDAEAEMLSDATYTTGWYLDLHTAPNFIATPELRANAILFSNLEVGASRNTNPGFLRSSPDGGVRIARGNVNFVADDTTFGPIAVKFNGKDLGQLDMAQVEGEVECGEETPGQSLTKTMKVNTYPYVAYADGVSWSGTVTLEDGGCSTVVLKAEDAVALD